MQDFLYDFFKLFTLFLIYSFIGWLLECSLALIKERKFINRGFLIGPIVPIWGAGAILIILILKVSDTPFSLIISSAFIGTFLEYIVNYLMEKIFKARWWDYSHLPFNLNGRVWLGSSIVFGLGGYILINYLNPLFINVINNIPRSMLCIINNILLIVLIIDLCLSCNIIKKLKLSAYSIKKDYTEEVSKKVRAVLEEKSRDFKRLLKAFPNVDFIIKNRKN